ARGMSHTIAFTPAPIETVFALLADPARYEEFVVGNSTIRSFDPDWPSEGATFHHSLGIKPFVVKDKSISLATDHAHLSRDGDADERARRVHHRVRAVADGRRHEDRDLRGGDQRSVRVAVEPPGGRPARLAQPAFAGAPVSSRRKGRGGWRRPTAGGCGSRPMTA